MKLILVRHGETHWNKEGLIQGCDSDIELNETGLKQAGKLAKFFENESITTILSSPLRRAISTAEVIAKHNGLSVGLDQGLRELKVGELEGMSISNLRTTFSLFLLQWWKEREATQLPNGESLVELQQRAWNVVERLLERYRTNPEQDENATVVVVSHYFTTLAIILKALDLPLDYFIKFKLDLGGISILEFRDHITRLLVFNDTSY